MKYLSLFLIIFSTTTLSKTSYYNTIYGDVLFSELEYFLKVAEEKCQINKNLIVCDYLVKYQQSDSINKNNHLIRIFEHEKTIQEVDFLLIKNN